MRRSVLSPSEAGGAAASPPAAVRAVTGSAKTGQRLLDMGLFKQMQRTALALSEARRVSYLTCVGPPGCHILRQSGEDKAKITWPSRAPTSNRSSAPASSIAR